MPGFQRTDRYDRLRVLEAAAAAAARRRRRRAISLYRQVLAREPHNPEVHARIAPLLASAGRRFDAWLSFRMAARELAREGAHDRAISLYQEATRSLPRELAAWLELAALQRRRRTSREALATLKAARHRFRGRRRRPQAIHLLRRARDVDPWGLDVSLELAHLLAGDAQREEALLLLDKLAAGSRGALHRRVCTARLRISPTLAHGWAWLRAALGADRTSVERSRASRRYPI